MPQFDIDISDRQSQLSVDVDRLRAAIEHVLSDEGITSAEISVALVDDTQIHRINREFLGHDYPTDVVSFLLNEGGRGSAVRGQRSEVSSPRPDVAGCARPDSQPSTFNLQPSTLNLQPAPYRHLDGELVVSTETAAREAIVHGWTAADELLLYVVHGMLHLCGYDDLNDEARPIMRDRERQLLLLWNLIPTGLEA